MAVEIQLLGRFAVRVDGQPVPAEAWRRRSAAALVKLLALQADRRMLREQVLDALWPELDPSDSAPRLHKAAHYARAALGSKEAVVAEGEWVVLLPREDVTIDVADFDRAAAAALSATPAKPAGPALTEEALTTALQLHRGDLLPDDLYEPWTAQPRERIQQQHVALLRRAGRWEELLALDPTDEEAHLRLVHRMATAGDREGALRRYDTMARTLADELGVRPSPTAEALRRSVLALPTQLDEVPAAAAGPAALPQPPTTTIGRDTDIEAVLQVLNEATLVTLLGPGGVGKTRLALEVARRHVDLTGVEAAFVDLSTLTHADAVPDLILRELGIRKPSTSESERALREALRGRSVLLVLDNFEHVADAAVTVAEVARAASEVRVLATSRAALRVPGERVVDVQPLSVSRPDRTATHGTPNTDGSHATNGSGPSDAVALFAQTALAWDPSFDLDATIGDVEAICRSLDGLPLAIELAAGQVRTLPPALLRGRLAAQLASPAGAHRALPERQRTVPATIDWSLQLLGSAEQQLFARLGIFSVPIRLETAEAVCAPLDGDVVSAMMRLVDQSLVRRVVGTAGEPRFTMLSLLRERAGQLLADDPEREATAARHAQHVGDFLDEVDEHRWTDAAGTWIDLIAEMLPEVRRAHAWALENGDAPLAARITAGMGGYWHRDGHHDEGRRWVTHALARTDDLADDLVARLHLAAGFVRWAHDGSDALPHWSAAAELFRAQHNQRYLAYALALQSGAFIGQPEAYDDAIVMCDEGIALARVVGEAPLLAQALNVKGELARVHGEDDLALAVYEEGRHLAELVGDEAHLTIFLANLSYLADHRGAYEEARAFASEALRLCWQLGRRMMAAWTVSEIAGPELGLGRPERGALLVGAADTALEMLGATRHPGDRQEHERVVAGLRAALGESDYQRLIEEGSRMTLDSAVALALEQPAGHRTPADVVHESGRPG